MINKRLLNIISLSIYLNSRPSLYFAVFSAIYFLSLIIWEVQPITAAYLHLSFSLTLPEFKPICWCMKRLMFLYQTIFYFYFNNFIFSLMESLKKGLSKTFKIWNTSYTYSNIFQKLSLQIKTIVIKPTIVDVSFFNLWLGQFG